MKTATKVDACKALLGAFDAARDAHRAVGADDTEPRQIGYGRIRRAAAGDFSRAVPVAPDGWDLYRPDEDEPDPKITPEACENAAADLYATCQAVVDFLKGLDAVPYGEAVTIRDLVATHCW